MLYFDHAASTFLSEETLRILDKSMREDFANPSAAHKIGKNLLKRIENSRVSFAKILDAEKDYDFVFTSSATESNNMIIKGLEVTDYDLIVNSLADHASLYNTVCATGCNRIEIPLNEGGEVNYTELAKSVSDMTRLIVVAHVNNHTGNIQDIFKIAKIVKEVSPSIHVHIDGVQSFGKIPFSLKDSLIDSYTISGHKIGAPKGISGVYIKKSSKLKTLLSGGGHEGGYRSSTLAAPLIFAFENAMKEAYENINANFKYMSDIHSKVINKLQESISFISFPFKNVSPYVLGAKISGISSDIIMRTLEAKDIFIASSSACSSKAKGANPVYTALGIPEREHKYILRISFSACQEEEEISNFVEIFCKVVNSMKHLRK